MADIMNPFERPAQSGNAIAQSDQQRAVAEVQAAMLIARMNPRDQVQAMDRILNACTRQGLAEAAVYQYARGGSDISGPSIRLAEAIAQQWGNIQFGIRELDQSGGESTVQAFAWDVETNTRREMTFQVKHERHTKQGAKKLTDPRDIYELVANQGARRLRACILGIIPGDVAEAAVNQCEVTMKSKADTSPDAIKKLLEAFHAFGVNKDQIEKRIQRRIDAIQPAQIVSLKKIYVSLRDGMSTAPDWFDPAAPKTMDDVVAQKQQKAETLNTETGEVTATATREDPNSGQQDLRAHHDAPPVQESAPKPLSLATLIKRLKAASSMDALQDIMTLPDVDALTAEEAADLTVIYDQRYDALSVQP